MSTQQGSRILVSVFLGCPLYVILCSLPDTFSFCILVSAPDSKFLSSFLSSFLYDQNLHNRNEKRNPYVKGIEQLFSKISWFKFLTHLQICYSDYAFLVSDDTIAGLETPEQ